MANQAKLDHQANYDTAVRRRLDRQRSQATTLEDGQLVARRLDVPEVPGA
jgi:hypothetical protein